MKKAIILAAGEGSRLKSLTPFKPLLLINNTPLLEITMSNLQIHTFSSTHIIFNSKEKSMDFNKLPSLAKKNVHYFFKDTISSLHSLQQAIRKIKLESNEHIFVSMVDSIVSPNDAKNFIQFCHSLNSDESAILVTRHIDDEKPLTLKVGDNGHVSCFQCATDDETLVTSGVYCFSSSIIPHLENMINNGQEKMRNFLSILLEVGHPIRVFEVEKTLDIDRPEDLKSALSFIKGIN